MRHALDDIHMTQEDDATSLFHADFLRFLHPDINYDLESTNWKSNCQLTIYGWQRERQCTDYSRYNWIKQCLLRLFGYTSLKSIIVDRSTEFGWLSSRTVRQLAPIHSVWTTIWSIVLLLQKNHLFIRKSLKNWTRSSHWGWPLRSANSSYKIHIQLLISCKAGELFPMSAYRPSHIRPGWDDAMIRIHPLNMGIVLVVWVTHHSMKKPGIQHYFWNIMYCEYDLSLNASSMPQVWHICIKLPALRHCLQLPHRIFLIGTPQWWACLALRKAPPSSWFLNQCISICWGVNTSWIIFSLRASPREELQAMYG